MAVEKPEEKAKPGLKERAGNYASRKFLGGAVGLGSGFIRKTGSGLRVIPDVAGIRSYWRGPATEQDGISEFNRLLRPSFPDEAQRDDTARGMRVIGLTMIGIAVLLGLSALFVSDPLFKLGAFFGFFVLSVHGTVQAHRAEQLRQGRLFGLREMF